MCMWYHTHMQVAAREDDAKNRSRDSWHQLPWLPSTHLFSTAPLPLWEVNHVSLSSLRVPRLQEPCVPVNLARMLGGTPDFLRALSRARSLASSSSESESEARWGGLFPTHFVSNTPQHAYSRICTHMRAYARICKQTFPRRSVLKSA